MWRKLMKSVGAGLILAVTAGLSACHHSPEERAEWITSKISSKLDLNAEQKAKLDAVRQAFLDLRKTHQADRAKHMEELKQVILSDRLEATQVKALVSERQKAVDDAMGTVFPKLAEFHDSLSPEQKQKAVELMEKLASHWES